MTKKLFTSLSLFVLLMLGYPAICQEEKAKDIAVEGAIVAFQKRTRHPVKPKTKGIATYVELWIVRIDNWLDKPTKEERYILVEYVLSERGLSDDEINSQKLKFVLRENQENQADCLGTILVGDSPPYKGRIVDLGDYEQTKSGTSENIPPLQNLLCFRAERPPIVIE